MGMGKMFQSDANMSIPILDRPTPLVITQVQQTARIRVDECGPEMAAATGKCCYFFSQCRNM